MKKAAVTPPFLFHSVQDHPRIFHEYSNADARCLFIRGRIRGWLTTPTISFRFSRDHFLQRPKDLTCLTRAVINQNDCGDTRHDDRGSAETPSAGLRATSSIHE